MSDYDVFRASQPGRTAVEPGRSSAEIDAELRDMSEPALRGLTRYLDIHKAWASMNDNERRAQRAQNELVRREGVAERETQRAAEAARIAGQLEARAEAAITAYKEQMRIAFLATGTEAQFNEQFPIMLAEWQRDQARANADAVRDQVRERVGGF